MTAHKISVGVAALAGLGAGLIIGYVVGTVNQWARECMFCIERREPLSES